ncbi:MAG: cellulase family glycosylhydrolase [Cyclobacteriaceae bacterium]
MKKIRIAKTLVVLFWAMTLISCEKDDIEPQLTVSETEVSFLDEGGTVEITITCSDEWRINNSASSWLQVSQLTGNSGTTIVQLTTEPNTLGSIRSVILNISSPNGQARRVKVSQPYIYTIPSIYPSYNTSPKAPDASGMSSSAVELVAKMGLGWNIGNTFEAPGGETGWGSPVITEEFIKFVKQQGFNAIRLPCAWDWHHIENPATALIDQNWLNRVKEVVGYCVNNDVYVLLNIHWDGGWLENNVTPNKKDSVNAKQRAYWEQIATTMRDFDEHLLFASANEPNADNAPEMEVLLSYHKTFIEAVRSTGGRNTYRTLVLQGHDDYIDPDNFPADPTPDRMAFEWHNYTPSSFTILDNDRVDGGWDDVRFYWSEANHSAIEPGRNCAYGEEAELLQGFNNIKTKFIDKGIPCLMGEYSSQRWTATRNKFTPLEMDKHNKSVDDWITFNTKQCKLIGAVPFFWDTGGALDRSNLTVRDQRTIDALLAGEN